MAEVGNAQKETYRVQNIGLAAAVQSCDGVEQRVEAVDLRPLCVGFESFNNDRLDVHLWAVLSRQIPEASFLLFESESVTEKAERCSPVFTTENW